MDFVKFAVDKALAGFSEIWLDKSRIRLRYGCTCTFEQKVERQLKPKGIRTAFAWGIGKEINSRIVFKKINS